MVKGGKGKRGKGGKGEKGKGERGKWGKGERGRGRGGDAQGRVNKMGECTDLRISMFNLSYSQVHSRHLSYIVNNRGFKFNSFVISRKLD